MKRCTICGAKLKKRNDASTDILGPEFMKTIKGYQKIQTICTDCKGDLLYSEIISPF